MAMVSACECISLHEVDLPTQYSCSLFDDEVRLIISIITAVFSLIHNLENLLSPDSLDGDNPSICGKSFIHVETGRVEFSIPPHGSTLKSTTVCSYKLLGNNRGNGNMAFSFQSFNQTTLSHQVIQALGMFKFRHFKYSFQTGTGAILIVRIVKETGEEIELLCGTTRPSKNFTTEGNALLFAVLAKTDPAMSYFKGYVYHEMLEPIPTTSEISTTQTIDNKQSTKTDISEP
ncbi:hypothetical protein D915_010268 [Fasciola hepatica]|uniref:CUB domain-containing protein n=1 Tax=Fasciola hepatica TaxID=6192 RepID=A0A4E0RB81_FASHE|nr:hypothetical protein D915_010268 [Fasciola hepatica]